MDIWTAIIGAGAALVTQLANVLYRRKTKTESMLERHIAELRDEIAMLKQEISELKKENTNCREDYWRVREEMAELRASFPSA